MNDNLPNLDELVSAYIDGEATDAEIARVESSPELAARVAELRSVAAAVAAPVPDPQAEHRDAAIAAAVAASATAPNVTSLASRRRRSARTMQLASVAAVVAVIMLAVPLILLSRNGSDDSDTTAASADIATAEEPAEDTATSDSVASAAEEAPADEPASEEPEAAAADEAAESDDAGLSQDDAAEEAADEEPAEGGDGDFDFDRLLREQYVVEPQSDTDAVAMALLAELDLAAAPADDPLPLGDDLVFLCLEQLTLTTDPSLERLGFTVSEIDGTPVLAVAFSTLEGQRFVTVAEVETCSVAAEFFE